MEDPSLGSLWWQPSPGPIRLVLVLVGLVLLVGVVREVLLEIDEPLVLDVEDVAGLGILESPTKKSLRRP